MKIRLGMNLDGQHGRSPVNQLGSADVGPLGLLGILETQLGLVAPSENNAERTIQYRDCLQQLDNADRFFHKSFQADDFGTAATLLSWRDTWRIHGWSGVISGEAHSRLKDMVAVEELAHTLLGAGMAERLQTILSLLDRRKLLIQSITLVDPVESFPALWQRVLKKLPIHQTDVDRASGKGLLGKLQHALIHHQTQDKPSTVDWQEDHTLLVVQGETPLTNARWIAEKLDQSGADTLYVATSEGARTDAFLAATGHACQGLSSASAFRPALQLLPLFLELLWKPLNFSALIEFLTHPICPLPGKVRRQFAQLLSQYPGIGSPRWIQLIEKIVEESPDNSKDIKASIEFWIDHPRYALENGVPLDVLLTRTQRLVEFFRNSPSNASASIRLAYNAGYQQCLAFAENLTRLLDQGVENLRQRQLEQLAAQATAHGTENPIRIAQVGARPCITDPAAVLAQHAIVLWGPLDAPALPGSWPWSKGEISILRSEGCELPLVESLLEKNAQDWLRPILAARERLIIVLPPSSQESHPVWQMIKAVVNNIPVHSIESILSNGAENLTRLAHKALTRPKRWLHLPEGTALPAVDAYSFSLLEKQLFNPSLWLLKDVAKLRAGSLLSLVDEFRLRGMLAHSLTERLFREINALDFTPDEFKNWFELNFDQLISEEGAVYLMPGRRMDRDNLRQILFRALIELCKILKAANVINVEPECDFEGRFIGGVLIGASDLVLTGPDNQQAIVDMKWAGKSHRTKLENNTHLQLAIYAELLRQRTGVWPALGNYLISQSKLLTRDNFWFKDTPPVKNLTEENTAQLWQRFLETWAWRQTQFADGSFEVVLGPNDDDDPNSVPPESGLELEILNKAYNEYLHLTGWEERA